MWEDKLSPDKLSSSANKCLANLAIFAGSLSEKTDQAVLTKYFSKFGEIGSVNLISDWTTGASKCCAIVICKTPTTLAKILAAQKHILDGKKIRVTVAEPERKGTKKISTNCLFVGNIPSKTKEADIKKIFLKYGTIVDSKFFRNASTKANTKNCIIEYSDSTAVEAAFKSKDTKEMAAHGFRISPLKHKNPSKKEKSKKTTTVMVNVKSTTEDEDYLDSNGMEEEENHGFEINQSELSPIIQTYPFKFFPENPSQSEEFPKSYNKASVDWASDLTNSGSQANSGSVQEEESLEAPEAFTCVVTLADLECEDDLAAAFFSAAPLLGSLRSAPVSLTAGRCGLQFE